MQFHWYCKQKNESFIRDPNDENELLYENGSFLLEQKISQADIDNNKALIGSDFQDGGCFGYGPGIRIIYS